MNKGLINGNLKPRYVIKNCINNNLNDRFFLYIVDSIMGIIFGAVTA
jgi:hypothetical protein